MSQEEKITLLGHLQELRKRLIRGAMAVVITTAISFFFVEQIEPRCSSDQKAVTELNHRSNVVGKWAGPQKNFFQDAVRIGSSGQRPKVD